jgi:hypothetical protein
LNSRPEEVEPAAVEGRGLRAGSSKVFADPDGDLSNSGGSSLSGSLSPEARREKLIRRRRLLAQYTVKPIPDTGR